jgi:hypothetical protein
VATLSPVDPRFCCGFPSACIPSKDLSGICEVKYSTDFEDVSHRSSMLSVLTRGFLSTW